MSKLSVPGALNQTPGAVERQHPRVLTFQTVERRVESHCTWDETAQSPSTPCNASECKPSSLPVTLNSCQRAWHKQVASVHLWDQVAFALWPWVTCPI